MPTTHAAPRVVSRRRAASKATRAKHSTPLGRFLKHPANSLWGLFSSVKTAIVLIALIATICVIGIIIVQAPVEITSSPGDFAQWLAQDMTDKYGHGWANLFQWLQFFTIFSSWYFKLCMVLLAINVTVCTLNRAPGIWNAFRYPAVRSNDRFYQNALARTDFYTPHDLDALHRFFRKKHYRVLTKANAASGTTYLYAHKNAWATLSTFVFHACLVALMLAAVITGWQGFGSNSAAQRLLPKPIYDYAQSLAGFSYAQPLPDGESGVVYPIGTPHNIIYRADQFVANFDPASGQPRDFYTDLTLFQDGKQVAQQRVRVNDPLTYQGVTFHQASFIMYAWITIKDDKGNIIFNQRPVLDEHLNDINPNTGDSIPVNVAQDIPLPNISQTMNVAATLTSTGWKVVITGSDQSGNPTFCGLAGEGFSAPLIDLSQGTLSCKQAIAALQLGDQGAVKTNVWILTVKLVKRGSVLLVTKDAGSPLIWPISFLMILALCITFYFPHRRVWVRYRSGHVQFAGLKEHFLNVQREFDLLARQLIAQKDEEEEDEAGEEAEEAAVEEDAVGEEVETEEEAGEEAPEEAAEQEAEAGSADTKKEVTAGD
jgi:cytochrome c biogenesis protein